MLELLSLSKLEDLVHSDLSNVEVVHLEMFEVRVDLTSELNVLVLVHVDVIWIVTISFVDQSKVRRIELLVVLLPGFGVHVDESTSLGVSSWEVFFAVILEELVSSCVLHNW